MFFRALKLLYLWKISTGNTCFPEFWRHKCSDENSTRYAMSLAKTSNIHFLGGISVPSSKIQHPRIIWEQRFMKENFDLHLNCYVCCAWKRKEFDFMGQNESSKVTKSIEFIRKFIIYPVTHQINTHAFIVVTHILVELLKLIRKMFSIYQQSTESKKKQQQQQ